MIKTEKLKRGRPKKINREYVLNFAMMSYWRCGSSFISINEICNRANVSKPGLYREFGNEDGLKQNVLNQYRTKFLCKIYKIIEIKQPFTLSIEDLLNFLQMERKSLELPFGCLLADMSEKKEQYREAKRQFPLTLEKIEYLQAEMLEALEAWIQRAKIRNGIKLDLPLSTSALYVHSQLLSVYRLQKEGVDEKSIELFFRTAMSVFLFK